MIAIQFSRQTIEPTTDHPRPERLVRGNPLRTTWNHYTDPSEQLNAGIWASEAGAWRIAYPLNLGEFFHVIEGEIALTDLSGTRTVYGPGDACVIPPGFEGLFEVTRAAKKHYVLWENAGCRTE